MKTPESPSSASAVIPGRKSLGIQLAIVIATGLWLASIGGSAVFLLTFPRFLPAANQLRGDAALKDADRTRPRPSDEELMRDQATLTFAAGEAILALGGVMAATAAASLLTLMLIRLNGRVALRELEARLGAMAERLKQLEIGHHANPTLEIESSEVGRNPPTRTRAPMRRKLAILIFLLGSVAITAALVWSWIDRASQQRNRLREDSALIQRLKEAGRLTAPANPGENFTLPVVGLEMIWVPPGTFAIGAENRDNARHARVVTITKGFWLGKYELKRDEYRAVMHGYPRGSRGGGDTPAENVSWFTAMDYCRQLTRIVLAAGQLPDGYVFTLPTEAQWECAYRAGGISVTPRDHRDLQQREADERFPWFGGARGDGPRPAGKGTPNAWGFYDMEGNLPEWCWDRYEFHLPAGRFIDPTGPSSSAGDFRVKRGWSDDRGGTSPDHATTESFRVALATQPP